VATTTSAEREENGITPLSEIDYRAWWLEEEIRSGSRPSDVTLLEEIAGIREAVERERVGHRLRASTDRLRVALDRADAWIASYDERHRATPPSPVLTLLQGGNAEEDDDGS
jgi:hypothetical protein